MRTTTSCGVALFRSPVRLHPTPHGCGTIRCRNTALPWRPEGGGDGDRDRDPPHRGPPWQGHPGAGAWWPGGRHRDRHRHSSNDNDKRRARSRRVLLRMAGHDGEGNDERKDRSPGTERRVREPREASFLDKLVDGALFLDTGKAGANQAPPVSTVVVLLAASVPPLAVLPNPTARAWFLGLLGLFSVLSEWCFRDPFGGEQGGLADEREAEHGGGSFVARWSLAGLGAFVSAGILAPLDSEAPAVAPAAGAVSRTGAPLLVAAAAAGLVLGYALFSSGGQGPETNDENDDDDDDDTPTKSSEEIAMELWDEEFRSEKDRRDGSR